MGQINPYFHRAFNAASTPVSASSSSSSRAASDSGNWLLDFLGLGDKKTTTVKTDYKTGFFGQALGNYDGGEQHVTIEARGPKEAVVTMKDYTGAGVHRQTLGAPPERRVKLTQVGNTTIAQELTNSGDGFLNHLNGTTKSAPANRVVLL
ncbi:hypothetical protein FWC63_01740 [Candidatus Saccharibacteria bacterium]|nr:hypothetical protein [Candidatus Saccharibacteria bacterium]